MQTAQLSLTPCLGEKHFDGNQAESGIYCHSAENIHIDETGKIFTRGAWQKIAEHTAINNLYYSPKFHEILCTDDGKISKITVEYDTMVSSLETKKPLNHQGVSETWKPFGNHFNILVSNLETISSNQPIFYTDLPTEILISRGDELLCFNGSELKPFTHDAPIQPILTREPNLGSLKAGTYHIAASYLFNGMKETALSAVSVIEVKESDTITITLSPDLSDKVEYIRLYMSEPNGGVLRKVSDYLPSKTQIEIGVNPVLGRVCEFQHKGAMIGGRYLCFAHGRVYVAQSNRLIYSEAMAYHLTDERYNYIEMPERISFVVAVNGGLWIGGRTSVWFLAGVNPDEWVLRSTGAVSPIAGSGILYHNHTFSTEITGSVAVWLSNDGYHIGTAGGDHLAPQQGVLKDIYGVSGQTVAINRRLYTAVYSG